MRALPMFMAAVTMLFVAGCDSPTGMVMGENLLENSKFVPSGPWKDDAGLDARMAPWKFNQIGAIPIADEGGDGEKGYVRLARMITAAS